MTSKIVTPVVGRRVRALVSLISVIACGSDGSSATTRCEGCSIAVVPGTTFGEIDGPASLLGDPPVRQDSRGRFYAASHATGGVLVFDSTRTYFRTIGRRGPGPGEFELITAILIDRFDTVYVFDGRHLRATVVSPSHTIIRTVRVPDAPPGGGSAILPDGRFVIASVKAGADRILHPIHVLDRNFMIDRSFGAGDEPIVIRDQLANGRLVAPDGAGRIWSSRLLEYVLELWSANGEKVREIRHDADWLPPHVPQRPWREGEPLPPPHPSIVGLSVDADDYIWVLGSVVDRNWKPPRVVRVRAGFLPIDEQTKDEAYDTMIEVFDGRSGRLVASLRHPMSFNQFVSPRTLIHRDEREDGRFLITTYQLRLAVAP
jgi:hypothetical protein